MVVGGRGTSTSIESWLVVTPINGLIQLNFMVCTLVNKSFSLLYGYTLNFKLS